MSARVVSPARAAALSVLTRVARGAALDEALDVGPVARLDERDRALLHELVLGTIRRRGWLDHVLQGLVERPLERVAPGVLAALRLGAYQLAFTRVAAHAAVSESVELARSAEPRAAGFANAVLRRLQREGPPAEPDTADALRWLTTYGSLPAWLAERWLARLGAARAIARARVLLEPPPLHFRLNPRQRESARALEEAGVRAEPSYAPGSLTLLEGRLFPLLESGVAYAQDAGSQLVARLACAGLAAAPGRAGGNLSVLDACAAPGGKSLLISDEAPAGTRVIAAERSAKRLRTMCRLVERWGARGLSIVAADALRPAFRRRFDCVLLDAPCSGLGTLARNPDIRWRCLPRELERQGVRQRALLESLSPLVAPGGLLVYCTCSIEPEENEQVVLPFLAAHAELRIAPLPDWAAPFREQGFLRIEPAAGRGDAFFAACLRRPA